MSEKFDINNINKNVYNIGKLTSDIIEILDIELNEADILISDDKIKYTEKHISDYENYQQYKEMTEKAPEIIAKPDYVGVHPKGQSIEFIKKLDKNILVAVRISNKNNMWVKSIYPITDSKLNIYIKSGRVKPL